MTATSRATPCGRSPPYTATPAGCRRRWSTRAPPSSWLGRPHRLGSTGAALDDHREALRLARELGNRYIETEALIGLAATHPDDEADLARQALSIARECGYRLLEARLRSH